MTRKQSVYRMEKVKNKKQIWQWDEDYFDELRKMEQEHFVKDYNDKFQDKKEVQKDEWNDVRFEKEWSKKQDLNQTEFEYEKGVGGASSYYLGSTESVKGSTRSPSSTTVWNGKTIEIALSLEI